MGISTGILRLLEGVIEDRHGESYFIIKGNNIKRALTKEVPNFLHRESTVHGIGCGNRTNLEKILSKL